MSQITTFVFFDIETTGLPFQERNRTKIIELSFVAALRSDIESTIIGDIPPVSKLTIVFNPDRQIHPQVTKLTGLSNAMLQHAPSFKSKSKTISSFLKDLPQPVCLVAHNGNIFDFKILLTECIEAGITLSSDILCVDSLIGFRKLMKGTSICHKTLDPRMKQQIDMKNVPRIKQNIENKEIEITDDEDDSSSEYDTCIQDNHYLKRNVAGGDAHNKKSYYDKAVVNRKNCDSNSDNEWPELEIDNAEWEEIDDVCKSLSDMSTTDMSDDHNSSLDSIDMNDTKTKLKMKDDREKAIKRVFEKRPQNVKKECFTLSAVYKRLLNMEDENAHRAEVDCIMLLRSVVALKTEFLQWADQASKPLTEIKPLLRY